VNRGPSPRQPARRTAFSLAYPVLAGILRARGWESLRTQPAVLVYQMAKVGSQTVVRSIRASRPRQPVFHVHTLTEEGMAAMEEFYRWSRLPSPLWGGHLLVSRYLSQQIRRGVTPGRWKIVTLVRDPVARNLSLLFQLGRRLLPDFEKQCDADRLDPIAVFEQFEADFPAQVNCMRWFRDELCPVFGVDPFAAPFDREAGYHVYRGPFADVLLLRTEDLDRSGEAALRSFLGLEQFRWKRANIGGRKANGIRYARLLDRLELPTAFVDRYYDTPEVRHFYSPEELNALRARWCAPRGAAS
jgi:Putative capsular polysaccharide synthesis protein